MMDGLVELEEFMFRQDGYAFVRTADHQREGRVVIHTERY
jgi:hypothetical protein